MKKGLILIDKPAGMTSMDVVRVVKRLSGENRVGHCGTLDPLASGLMVVLLGKATQLQDEFLLGDKTYSGLIKLGLKTETDDILGATISEDNLEKLFETKTREQILEEIKLNFEGSGEQFPPAYSALHVNGERSYKIARRGEVPELKARTVKLSFIDLRFHSHSTIRFEVRCSKGTYIRALARDIGEHFACGACIQSLRRIHSFPYDLKEAVTLEELSEKGVEKYLSPIETAVSHLPRVELDTQSLRNLAQGRQVLLGRIRFDKNASKAAVFSKKGLLFGLIEDKSAEGMAPVWKLKWIMPEIIDSTPYL